MSQTTSDTQNAIAHPELISDLIHAATVYRQFQSAESRLLLQIKAIDRRLCQRHADIQSIGAEPEGDGGDHSKCDDHSAFVAPSPSSWKGIKNAVSMWGAKGLIDLYDDAHRHKLAAEKQVEALAQSLPVMPWIETVRGVGPKGLGLIIGETGDLTNYAGPAKVWKRLGLAVAENGKAQRRVKGKATKAGDERTLTEGELQGFSPRRRALMHVIGDNLIKQNGADGEFRQVYDARKAYEREQAEAQGLKVVPTAKIPKKHPEQYRSEWYVHKRAMRYMEKRFLLRLWQEWRRATSDQMDTTPALLSVVNRDAA